ncbi:MAG: mannonate dehydratase [Campylobacteraceae bacterium]|nr:mannonate dehydratase [Campylobacteraceae bacterium]
MKMTFRWYGKNDKIPLSHIAQIPNIDGIVTSLINIKVGEVWPLEELEELKKEVNKYNLNLEVIESVNVHEDIKLGLKSRDLYISNYKKTLDNLSKIGIQTVCYNFMPIFDWTRTDLAKVLDDKSTVLSFDNDELKNLSANDLVEKLRNDSSDVEIPGWEKERLDELENLFKLYEKVDENKLWENLEYFLKEIIPYSQNLNIKMAIHPDDPPFSIFGLPRIITNEKALEKVLNIYPSISNGLALCTGSLGPNSDNDLVSMIRKFASQNKIHFAHIRNIKRISEKSFHESSHFSKDGSLDLYEIVKAYADNNFKGHVRPDHGRMIWGEKGMPGYGLYDRALGITYLNGLYEAITKAKK